MKTGRSKLTSIRLSGCWGSCLAVLLATALPALSGAGRQGSVPTAAPQAGTKTNGFKEDTATQQPKLEKPGQRYRLRPGDVIELTFPLTAEFNQTLTVQPDGYITPRGVGDLRADGKTVPELTQELRAAYSRILNEPIITVDLKDFEKPYFIVGGEVGRPGKFELRGATSVCEAVAIAGGLRDSAKHSQVLLIRRLSDGLAEVKVLNVKKMLQSGNLEEDPHLRAGDMLFVPKNALSKVRPFIPIPGVGVSFNPGLY